MEAIKNPPRETVSQFDDFSQRHIGPRVAEVAQMLATIKASSVDSLIDEIVPSSIRLKTTLNLPRAISESQALTELKTLASKNKVWKSYLGQGYYNTITPPLLQREILENAGWYTAYTPYQPEISQGRLEALLNFQTMIADLTALPIANASLLDEGTAAAEAMALCLHTQEDSSTRIFFVSEDCHPQTIDIILTRAKPLGVKVLVGHPSQIKGQSLLGALIQYPDTKGAVKNWSNFAAEVHAAGGLFIVACDLLALTLYKAPGEFGADIAVGSAQRFGVPLGFGGPHAAFFAVKEDLQRRIPGRIVGVSKDSSGKPALRLALQTREQHIRREKATSNICTAQVLLAVISAMYAVYHGPEGLVKIAKRIQDFALRLKSRLEQLGYTVGAEAIFDTVKLEATPDKISAVIKNANARRINFRIIDSKTLTISLDETVTDRDFEEILSVFGDVEQASKINHEIPVELKRNTTFLTHPIFSSFHSETEMLRYLRRLEAKDLSLVHSMIALGSCTMKLNAASEMMPVTWPEFGGIHPFVPKDQVQGYLEMIGQLESWLAEITGFSAVSLQPNAGSQGEYAGLLAIREALNARGHSHRKTCLIPVSAHGTNPASAAMVGMNIVAVACLEDGDIDIVDLKQKVLTHAADLAACMITYPSTHGVFEEGIKQICELVHEQGGFVYMDGANMNAQVGLCRPADIGADVCHLNLHKTFCIPHGGGGPGMGPIAVTAELAPYLPRHRSLVDQEKRRGGSVSAAPFGSASILTISWMYIRMMGAQGLTQATKNAILNANYIASRLDRDYPVLFRGRSGRVAHECIVDPRGLKKMDITVEDIAKRLMDYGFHAPTVSFPVVGTLMIEPTESESKSEIDRFCDAMISIREEVRKIENGEWPRQNNPLKNAPHTAESVTADNWDKPYSRKTAAFPLPGQQQRKYWPTVSRIDGAYGDRNFFCSCSALS